MDYEKEYKEARDRATKVIMRCRPLSTEANLAVHYALSYVFPATTESEAERIRKDIIAFLQSMNGHCNPTQDWDLRNRWLPYLEKQKEPLTPEEKMNHPLYLEGFDVGKKVGEALKEQKPVNFYVPEGIDMNDPKSKIAVILGIYSEQTGMPQEEYLSLLKFLGEQHPANSEEPKEWSEEDYKNLARIENLLIAIAEKKQRLPITDAIDRELLEWLKPLRPFKQEWSEEEQTIIDCAVEIVEKAGLPSLAASLKSLRPQPHWKPSEEQMEWLESAVKLSTDKPHIHGIIISLYEQLKRL